MSQELPHFELIKKGSAHSTIAAIVNLLASNKVLYNFIISSNTGDSNPVRRELIRLLLSKSRNTFVLENLLVPGSKHHGYLDVCSYLIQVLDQLDSDTRSLLNLTYSERRMCGCITTAATINGYKIKVSTLELFENNLPVNTTELISNWANYANGMCDVCQSLCYTRRTLTRVSDFIIIEQPSCMKENEIVVSVMKSGSETLHIGDAIFRLVGGITWQWFNHCVTWYKENDEQWIKVEGVTHNRTKLGDEIDNFHVLLYQRDLQL